MRFSSFYNGTVRMSLTDPDGTIFGPNGAGSVVGYAVDDVSEVYELASLVSGTWTINLDAVQVPLEGADVTIATAIIDIEESGVNDPPILS